MSLAIVFINKDETPWAEALKRKLPGVEVEIYPDIADFEKVEFILAWKAIAGIFEMFPNLKAIQSMGASVSHIYKIFDVPETIAVSRIVDFRLADDMWEFLLGLILKDMKNLDQYALNKAAKNWQPVEYRCIHETTVSILGAGKIGMHVAKQLEKIGFKVNIWSRSKKEVENINSYVGLDELKQFLATTDYLIDILPLTEATRDLIDYDFLSQMNPNGIFINVGRGEQLVDHDLISLIDDKKLRGAILDVFHQEPLPLDHPFWTHAKIQITPHVASNTNIETSTELISENYKRLITGENLLHLVSKEKGY